MKRPSDNQIVAVSGVVIIALLVAAGLVHFQQNESVDSETSLQPHLNTPTARMFEKGRLSFWWDEIPASVRKTGFSTGPESNIHPGDYAGPDSCRKCHQRNYSDWSKHPHRWMNAVADESTVKGDFSGRSDIRYLKGRATFGRVGDEYRMTLVRGETELVYSVRQTIGSRFFQYYIGRLIAGPFPKGHEYRTVDHVLPFGYWLDRKEWVPVVHVDTENPDGERSDPFALPREPIRGDGFIPYAGFCNMCHTTFPLGDNLTRKPFVVSKHAPSRLHWDMASYTFDEHPELWPPIGNRTDATLEQILAVPETMVDFTAPEHAVTLGISCEACHFGCAEHARDSKNSPKFLPHSPHLLFEGDKSQLKPGRTQKNVNWICGRCHTGDRPRFAGGMSTWNSTEFSDAVLGSCYSELKCIDCHAPHKATGHRWSSTPAQDDARCIKCHAKFEDPKAVSAHSHHSVESSGSRCMNCHMPRINEGLQDVVRTHTIYSPTQKEMIESNHPNACNLCHTDRPIDWTLQHLAQWYDADWSEQKLREAYSDREAPVAIGWLKSENEAVRLVAADAIGRAGDQSAIDELITSLDDPFLLNRQFTRVAVEKLLQVSLQDYGYRFYMTPEERAEGIARLRKALSEGKLKARDRPPEPSTRQD